MSRIIKPQFGRQLNYGHPLAQGLVGCWLMNEGCGDRIADLSGNGNTGTLKNMGATAASGWNPGKFGHALAFDGVNDVVVAASGIPALLIGDSFTWSFRVYLEAGNDHNATIIGNRSGGVGSPLQFIKFTPANFEYYIGGTNPRLGYNIPTDQWCHVTVTKNGANFTYYLNAIVVTTGITTADMAANPLYIGAGKLDGTAEPANCRIDAVWLYNGVALSASEVSWLYQSPFAMFDQRRIWAVGGTIYDVAVSLSQSLCISPSGTVTGEAAISASLVQALAGAGGATAEGTTAISSYQELAASGQASVEVVFALGYLLAAQNTGQATTESELGLAIQKGLTTSATGEIQVSISLPESLDVSAQGIVTAEGIISLTQIQAITTLATALIEAGISLTQVTSLTLTATSIIAGLITPDNRTMTIAAEARMMTIDAENRTFLIT